MNTPQTNLQNALTYLSWRFWDRAPAHLTQIEKVRWYLERGYKLTVLDAIRLKMGTELRSKICAIKRKDPDFGKLIKSEPVKGEDYNVYYLERAA